MITEEVYNSAKKVVKTYEQQIRQRPENCFTFNINDKILVKLNDEGFRHWKKDFNEYLPDNLHIGLDELKQRANNEGFVEFQAWEFIRIFGQTISMGISTHFETAVRFYKNELKELK